MRPGCPLPSPPCISVSPLVISGAMGTPWDHGNMGVTLPLSPGTWVPFLALQLRGGCVSAGETAPDTRVPVVTRLHPDTQTHSVTPSPTPQHHKHPNTWPHTLTHPRAWWWWWARMGPCGKTEAPGDLAHNGDAEAQETRPSPPSPNGDTEALGGDTTEHLLLPPCSGEGVTRHGRGVGGPQQPPGSPGRGTWC